MDIETKTKIINAVEQYKKENKNNFWPTISQLADAVGVTVGTISKQVKHLVEQGDLLYFPSTWRRGQKRRVRVND